jgi:hypothetical protein
MQRHCSLSVLASFFLLILMNSCSDSEKDWEKSKSVNTIEAYNQFINMYPSDTHVSDAKLQISRIQILGKWESPAQSSMLEFFDSGRFHAEFPFKIASGSTLGEKMPGIKIDMGVKLIQYAPKNKLSTWLTKEDATRFNVDGEFKVARNARNLWAKVLIYTDDDGNVKILKEYEHQKLSSFKAAGSDTLRFFLNIDNRPVQINQLSLMINSIDLELNWLGVLTADGVYMVKGENSFEAYIPLENKKLQLVIVDGNINTNRLTLANINLGLTKEEYQKMMTPSK